MTVQKIPRHILPNSGIPNIIEHIGKFKMPEHVYVVASGPTVPEYLPQIPRDSFTIALNTTILQPFPWVWWIAFDHRILDYDWWNTIEEPQCMKLYGSRLVNRLMVLETGQHRMMRPDYYFSYLPNIECRTSVRPTITETPQSQMLMPTALRGGLTITGVGLQFAFWAGAKHITLIGADMQGCGHHHGYNMPDPHGIYTGTWPYARLLTQLCSEITNRGCLVDSLSPTAIQIPRCQL